MIRVIAECPNCNYKYIVWIPMIPFIEKCRHCDKLVTWKVKLISDIEELPKE